MCWRTSLNLNNAGPCITINFTLEYIVWWSGDLLYFQPWYFLLGSLSEYYLFTIIQNSEFCGRHSKSEIKVERWKCYLAHSHVWNNNTRMIFLRLSRQPSLAGVVTFPGITTTRWRADVNRKEYQRRAIRKSSARQEWYSVRCAAVRISLVRSVVPLFPVFPMFTLSLDPADNVITSNLSKLHISQ